MAKDFMKISGSLALKLWLSLSALAAVAAAATPPVLSASPSAVDFQYDYPAPQPQPVMVTVTASDGSSPALTFTLAPATGKAATLFSTSTLVVQGNTISVGYDNNTLNQLLNFPGIYSASITVTAAGFATLTIPVSFGIGGVLAIVPSPISLAFTAPSGPTVQSVALSGDGTAVSFSLATSTTGGGAWLSATANASYTPATLTVTISALNLPAGPYAGSIAVTPSSGAPLVIPVTLQVGSGTLTPSPASLGFDYTVGGTIPPPQILQVSTVSNDTYTAQAASTGNWLLVNGVTTKVSGSLPASLNVTVNPAGLAAGMYSGTIAVTDANGATLTVAVTTAVSNVSSVANPPTLVFVAQTGGPAPPGQIVAVNGTINSSYTATVSGSWLSVSSEGGTAPAQFTVTASPAGLQPGTYSGHVDVDMDTRVQDIQVTFVVSKGPVLTTDPGSIVSYFGGGGPPPPVALDVSASSGPAQSFTIASGVPAWLQIVSNVPGLTTPTQLTVTLGAETLPTGTYLADIILTPVGTGGPAVVVPVLLVIANAIAVVPNPTSLSFSAAAGSGPQSMTVEVSASSATQFTAGATTASGGTWLSVSPTSAVANTGNTALTVTADATNLADGNYQGTVTLTTAGGVITQIPVAFAVTSGSGLVTISSSILAFAYTQNGTLPVAQSLQITSSLSFTASAGTSTGGTWLAVTPTSGVGKATLSVSVNPAGLPPNTYNGTITITPLGAAAQTVAVTLTVSPAPALTATPNPLAFAYTTGNPVPAPQTVSVTSGRLAVSFTAVASSSGWLSVTPGAGTPPATLSVSVNPANLGAGVYNGSIALSGGSGTLQLSVSVSLTVIAPLPVIDSLANGASYLTGGISPGEIVTIFGSSLGPTPGVGASVDSKGYIETTLANVQVTFNGYPAPILYAGAGQINAIAPYELAGTPNVSVEAIFGSARSNTVTLPVVSSAPGIFSADASGQGPGAILDVSYRLVSASNPVSAGSVIQIFATGQGQTSPAGVDGLIEPLSPPWPSPVLPPGVTIGGLPANIQYIGAAPGLVAGALQVNVVVPDGVASGAAPLFLSFGGIANSQAGITVAIK